jgi:hypothetical protein
MTIKMRLDTDALRALIKDNPEIELEIGQAVLNNIQADTIRRRVEGQIEACLKGMVKNEGSFYQARYVPVDKQFTTLVNKVVVDAVTHFTNEGLKAHVDNLAAQAVREERDRVGADLRAILRTLITPEMAKEIVREKVLL